MFSNRCASLAVKSLKSLGGAGVASRSSVLGSVAKRVVAARQISHSSPKLSGAHQELCSALEHEIEAEKKLEQDNLGGSSPPVINGFSVTTDGAEVRLSKSHGSEKILVVFNVNHSVDVDDDFEGLEQTSVPVSRPHFSIEVTKGGQRLCFEMELTESEDGNYDVQVEEFYIAPAAKGNNVEVDEKVYSSAGKFIDPGLHELLFLRYLEERGFTTDFCNQMVSYATHYEHAQYVNLLKNIKNFVASG